ncbi:M13 family metallopeptidase [Williamsia sp. CHRR-6]|uniref:M13 family metallopeptidase n=1 Tax=Williamsia sp. CHRR-6 TaxID=2835871 RepID=UPI001BD91CD3|nr:M13 family metallopeptidase [Williamsia sp. CHRR-6]MBT0567505.1 M13 family metallopeptidase [Williamsia sp. CHRR-6]
MQDGRVTAIDDTRAPRPSGIDLQWVNSTTRPQDDLYEHVNGAWIAAHEIPADRPIDGSFLALRDRAEQDVRVIIEECSTATESEPGSDVQLIGDLYRSFMDEARIESLGITPVQPYLDAIDAITDTAGLAREIGRLQRNGIGGAVGFYVNTDAKQSDRYLVHLSQSGLGLPDESYYHDDKHAQTLETYVAHVQAMFALAGFDDAAVRAESVVELETALAEHHWDVVARRDADKRYNLRTLAQVRTEASGFDVDAWIDGLGAQPEAFGETVVGQPSFLTGLGSLIAERELAQWKTWLQWRVLASAAPYLSSAFVDKHFDFYGRTLSGTPENRERWKRGVSLVEAAVGFAVGKLYVQRHYPPAAKARMDELIANLVEAYRRNITDLEWMSPETRERALTKLSKFTPKVGHPASWRDYSGLVIEADDLIGNVARASAFEQDREMAKLGGPVDRDEWFMTPQTVNAYYNPGMNEIVFPAAILQPPFFDPDADDAANYGGIGAVIGHEIGHGFDDQGAKYDGDGNLIDWWTESDRTEFGKRTAMLIEQYNGFTPAGLDAEHTVNGAFTIGENIGDLGGLSIALQAYKIATEGTEPPVLDGLTGLQRVFFGWAQVWRTKTREAEAIRRLSIDPHSPPEFRCNGVIRNVDDFYTAFDVRPTDALYLEPDQRVRIW